uniref:BORC8 protein n=1 Tax=Otus sunia TaxID=257818 RepID=A0A8C8B6Y4_9STRI
MFLLNASAWHPECGTGSQAGDRIQTQFLVKSSQSPRLGRAGSAYRCGLPLPGECLTVLPSLLFQSDMQSWEEQSQGAIYTVEYACSAIKNMTDSSVYFKSIDSLLKHAIAMKDQLNAAQGRSAVAPQAKNPPASS